MDPKRGAIRKPDTLRNGPDTSSGSLVTYRLKGSPKAKAEAVKALEIDDKSCLPIPRRPMTFLC